jgi:hypothetical protein
MRPEQHEEPEPAPTGLPDDAQESAPLGPTHADPDGEGEGEGRERGPSVMPGIPDKGEPPNAG